LQTQVPITSAVAELDRGPGARGRIGFIALANGHTSELEVREILPYPDIAMYVNRIDSSNEITIDTLRDQHRDLTRAASLILPSGRLDVMVYGCTSGTIAMGEATVAARIHEVRPGIPISTPFAAAVAALATLQAKRIALMMPYTVPVARMMSDCLEDKGISVLRVATCNIEHDSDMNRVSPASIHRIVRELEGPDVDAYFICCTALRGNDVIERLERDLGKPVISSNQALAWHALRIAGYKDAVPNFGRLLRSQLSEAETSP
jgi:maleate isomerase